MKNSAIKDSIDYETIKAVEEVDVLYDSKERVMVFSEVGEIKTHKVSTIDGHVEEVPYGVGLGNALSSMYRNDPFDSSHIMEYLVEQTEQNQEKED